tara:strand:- start:650 stop:844 length:195 start_codon:yes stop_codon:yes gene_type:complete
MRPVFYGLGGHAMRAQDLEALAKRIDRVANLIRLECKQRGDLYYIQARAAEIQSLSEHLIGADK